MRVLKIAIPVWLKISSVKILNRIFTFGLPAFNMPTFRRWTNRRFCPEVKPRDRQTVVRLQKSNS